MLGKYKPMGRSGWDIKPNSKIIPNIEFSIASCSKQIFPAETIYQAWTFTFNIMEVKVEVGIPEPKNVKSLVVTSQHPYRGSLHSNYLGKFIATISRRLGKHQNGVVDWEGNPSWNAPNIQVLEFTIKRRGSPFHLRSPPLKSGLAVQEGHQFDPYLVSHVSRPSVNLEIWRSYRNREKVGLKTRNWDPHWGKL